MSSRTFDTIDEIVKILCKAAKEVLESGTNSRISVSPAILQVPTTHMRPDIGCFAEFSGDFSGLVILNFEARAAVEVYRKYMLTLGMPDEDLAEAHTSDEVINSIGEIANQILGRFRAILEKIFRVNIDNHKPSAVIISKSIQTSIGSEGSEQQSRRISVKTEERNRFYIELTTENIQILPFFPLDPKLGIENEDIFDPMPEPKPPWGSFSGLGE